MKLALISDVHANAVALEAVLADMDERGVGGILSAGDVVGYYPYPRETIALFQERSIVSIQGNHDRAVLSAGDTRMNPWARNAISWTVTRLDDEELDYLRRLPRHLSIVIDGTEVAMYHGAPFDDDYYLYEEEATEDLLIMAKCDLLVLGHTHVPFIKRYKRGMIVNPGSVGQPRDGDPDACYSIYDTSNRKTFILRVPYDIEVVAKRTRAEGLPARLADRLFEGY